MSNSNVMFMYDNMLRAAELRIPVNVMFSENMANALIKWVPMLRMEPVASAIALLNVVATTLQFSNVERTLDGSRRVPVNLFNFIVARSSYGKSDIAELVRYLLSLIDEANNENNDYWMDEFTRAGLMNSLDKSTKIFISDEADIAFTESGLFYGFGKPSAEVNCRSCVMILFDRMFSTYVRRLAQRRVVVEKSKLNLLGLSTGELMGQMIVRLKNGGYWDPMIPRFVWWVLDGEPIMETMEGVVLDYSIPSIEQVGFAASLFKNCTFKYENDAFKRVMEWSNSMKLKSHAIRREAALSSIVGKTVQQMHRFAGLLQTIENGFNICNTYFERFGSFQVDGKVKGIFKDRCEGIYAEMFESQLNSLEENPVFFITDQVAERAIDMSSGLLQQLKLLMDDSNVPENRTHMCKCTCSSSIDENKNRNVAKKPHEEVTKLAGYMSTEKYRRIGANILLYPALCFTLKQLDKVSFLHNVEKAHIRAVLKHLIESDLLHCIPGGIRTTRRSTDIYIKRLPVCHDDGFFDEEELELWNNHFKEFKSENKPTIDVKIDDYLKIKSIINLKHISGKPKQILFDFLKLPEYNNIDISPLYAMNNEDDMTSNDDLISVKDTQTIGNASSISSIIEEEEEEISNIFKGISDEIELISMIGAGTDNSNEFVMNKNHMENIQTNSLPCADVNVQHTEVIDNDEYSNLMSATANPMVKQMVTGDELIEKKKRKRKNACENKEQCESDGFIGTFMSPPSSRLRSKSRQSHLHEAGVCGPNKEKH